MRKWLFAALWIVISAPLIGVVTSCLAAFVVLMLVEWRQICRRHPLDRAPTNDELKH